MGEAADIDPKNDCCPPNGAAVDEPKSPIPKGDATAPSSDILLLLLLTDAVDGADEASNATSRELTASPELS